MHKSTLEAGDQNLHSQMALPEHLRLPDDNVRVGAQHAPPPAKPGFESAAKLNLPATTRGT
jgi:hypothetical protein